MSIHAQLTPEAQAQLEQQRRNSTISSILIAALSLGLVATLLIVLTLNLVAPEPETIVAYRAESDPEDTIDDKKIKKVSLKKPSRPSSAQARVIVAPVTASVSVPVTDEIIIDPSDDFGAGDGDDFGEEFVDDALTSAGAGIPLILKKRCSAEDRMARLLESGGSAECEEAVIKTLDWLKKTQQEDGSWPTKRYNVAMTSMALLAFLGHCETPLSKDYGVTVTKGINYLINISQKNDGRLATNFSDRKWVYEHPLGVYALAEAYTLSKGFGVAKNIPGFEDAVVKGGQFIMDHQSSSGSWQYAYSPSGGDNSIGGWHLQALKACQLTGFKEFKGVQMKKCIEEGLDAITRSQNSSGAIGYAIGSKTGKPTLTAVGALCLQIHGKSRSKETRDAIKSLHRELATDYKSIEYDIYGMYYAAQAMINVGGKKWQSFNQSFLPSLLSHQNPNGAWQRAAEGKKLVNHSAAHWNGSGPYALHYRTCMAALILESYYRFLPASKGE